MGIDLNPFSAAITKAKAGMKDFAEHSSEHMDRAATSGRALHGVLNEIGKISPGLSLGLTAAFSGRLAALELFRMGLEAIRDHFAEAKKAAGEYSAQQIVEVMKHQDEMEIESKTGGPSVEVLAVSHEVATSEKKMDNLRKSLDAAHKETEEARKQAPDTTGQIYKGSLTKRFENAFVERRAA